jgi:hypothetical protein
MESKALSQLMAGVNKSRQKFSTRFLIKNEIFHRGDYFVPRVSDTSKATAGGLE